MSLLTYANMREGSLAEFAAGCALSVEEASNTNITAAIARLTSRLEDWTSDKYESFTQTIDVHGLGGKLLSLPYRTTAVTEVTFRQSDGSYSAAQDATSYYLSSSLNDAGDAAVTDQDYLEVAPWSTGFSQSDIWPFWDPWRWPVGPKIVRVTGTFGWTTPPADAKRAVAMLVWDHFKQTRADLGRAIRTQDTSGLVIDMGATDVDHPSGIPRVDEIVSILKREALVVTG